MWGTILTLLVYEAPYLDFFSLYAPNSPGPAVWEMHSGVKTGNIKRGPPETYRGVARNLFRRGQNGDWGQKSPSGVQGQIPSGGLGAKPPEAQDIYANNHCNNVFTKKP